MREFFKPVDLLGPFSYIKAPASLLEIVSSV